MKVFLFYLLLRLYRIFISIKVEYEFDIQNYPKPVIFAFWHEIILFLPFAAPKRRNVDILISTHKDGRFASGIIRYFGLGTIGGSSNREPTKAFLSMLKKIKQNKNDIGITPDGPRGPRRKLKYGVVELAYLSKSYIVPVTCKTSNAWRVNSWDKMIIPKPFSKVVFKFSEPIYINSKDEMKSKSKILEDRLSAF